MERWGLSLGSNWLLRGARGKQRSPAVPSRRAEGCLLAPSPSLSACRRDVGDQDVAAHTTEPLQVAEPTARLGSRRQRTGRMRRCSERGHSLRARAAPGHKLRGAGGPRIALGAGHSRHPALLFGTNSLHSSSQLTCISMLRRKADLEKSLKTKRAK